MFARSAAQAMALAICCVGVVSASPTALYQYDGQGRLTRACIARPGHGDLTRHTLDKAGNRTAYMNTKVDVALSPDSGIFSQNGNFVLWMQTDGNLVLYNKSGSGWVAVWATGTTGSGAVVTHFQSDGNLVLYTQQGVAVWNSATGNNPCSELAVGDNGNVTITTPDGAVVWATNTGG